MNILYVDGFKEVDDPVRTEEVVQEQLISLADKIDTDYTYVRMPLAYWINTKGIEKVQRIVSQIVKENDKLFFVCQHIMVNKINFGDNLVFTPHATVLDSFIPIPHFSCSYNTSNCRPFDKRKYTFSFIGSFMTHPVRGKMYEHLKTREDCLVIDTGHWHFQNSKIKKIFNSRKYTKVLGNTKYSLCPRGTGPSTIRIWESMAMGAAPVIISDILKMPHGVNSDDGLWLRVPESLESLEATCANMKEYNNDKYFQLYSNDNLYKSILPFL